MVDVFQVADLLVSYAVGSYGEEIDLIGYYGSYAQGVATDESDLDIFYIPADGKHPPVSHTVLIAGILFDFWPITWETMEGFASGRIRGWAYAPALVHHAKVLYSRADAAAVRLAGLQQHIVDLQQPAARPHMVQRALDRFQCVYTHLGKLRLATASGDFTDVRHAGWQVISAALECLALANQTFFERGGCAMLEQLARLQARPANLEHLITIISTSTEPTDIAAAAEALAVGTRQVLRQCQASRPAQQTVHDQFRNAYPEINAQIGKVLSACRQQHPVAASSAAWITQHDVGLMLAALGNETGSHPEFNCYSEYSGLYREIGLPDLMSEPFSDLRTVAEQAMVFDTRLRSWLCAQSVALNEYRTVEEFAQSLTDAGETQTAEGEARGNHSADTIS